MNSEPKRLSEAGGPLAAMLKAANEDVLSEQSVRQVRNGLVGAGLLGGPPPLGGGADPVAPIAPPHRWGINVATAKVGAVLAVVAVAGGAITMIHEANRSRAANTEAQRASIRAAPAPAPPAPTEVLSQRADRVADTSSDGSSGAAIAETTPVPHVTSAPLGAPVPRLEAPAPPKLETSLRPPPPPASPQAPLAREGALLLEARRSLDTDPAHSLDLVRQHAAEFPASQLNPERERIASEAQKRIGSSVRH
jgi:hypothetical protein